MYKTVYNTVKRFKETGEISDRPRSGRPKLVRTSDRVKHVREKVHRNPARSIQKLAKEENVSYGTMHNIIRGDLKLIPYKKIKVQLLSEATKKKKT
jgi:transposase